MNSLYKLPKSLIAILFIGAGIVFIILNDPPHTFCDSQAEQFKKLQKGLLYKDTKDFHQEKSTLKRKKNTCQKENAPGACYEYFAYLNQLLKDFKVLSKECSTKVFKSPRVKEALSSALSLIVQLAWKKEVLTGHASKYNWLSRADISLFCKIKNKYISYYGLENYKALEKKTLNLLPTEQKSSNKLIIRKTLFSESCLRI